MKFLIYTKMKNISEKSCIGNIRDAIRCMIIIREPKDINTILEKLIEIIRKQEEEIKITFDNKWISSTTLNTGYASFHVFLLIPIQKQRFIIGELQLQFPEMLTAMKCQREIYETIRTLK